MSFLVSEVADLSSASDSCDSFLREIACAPAIAVDFVDPHAPVIATLGALSETPEFPHLDPSGLPQVPREVYQVHGEYARGGMGRVLLATDLRLGRRVAIKEVLSLSARAIHRFIHEAMITARLQHPGIVPIHEVGRWPDGTAFYAMKLIAGHSLSRQIRERTNLAERLGLLPSVLAVAEAIAYAHDQCVLHRDLKPDNVVVGAFGETVVIDWGLAVRMEEPRGEVAGTPAYMAPELLQGAPADLRTDVYALGAILYHLLRGSAPYRGSSAEDVLDQRRQGPPEPLRKSQPRAPVELLAIVDKAMAQDPAERYQAAGEFAQDLSRFLRGQLVPAHQYSPLQLLFRFVQRHRAAVSMGVLGLLLVGVTATFLLRLVLRERDRGDAERRTAQQALGLRASDLAAIPGNEVDALLSAVRAAGPTLAQGEEPGPAETRGLVAAVAAGRQVLPLRGHEGPVSAARFSASGALVVTGGADRRARVWDTQRGALLHTLRSSVGVLRDVAVLPGDTQVLLVGAEGAALHSLENGAMIRRFPGRPLLSDGDAASPDGRFLVLRGTEADAPLSLWEMSGQRVALLAGSERTMQLRFSGDGTRIFLGASTNEGRLYEAKSGRLLHVFAEKRPVMRVAISPDGRMLVTTTDESDAHVWDGISGKRLAALEESPPRLREVSISADGQQVVGITIERTAFLWDTNQGHLRLRVQHPSAVKRVLFSQREDRVVSSTVDGNVHLWDSLSGQILTTLRGHHGVIPTLALSPDGGRLLSAGLDGAVRLYNIQQVPRPAVVRTPGMISWLAFTPPGAPKKMLLTGGYDGAVRAWDAAGGQRLGQMRCSKDDVVRGAFSVDGRALVTRGAETICVWDLTVLGLRRRIDLDHGTPGNTVDMDPTGQRVAANVHDEALILDAGSGAVLRRLRGHEGAVSHVSFSPDGRRLATSGADRTARLWDAEDGRLLSVMRGHLGPVNEVRFSPDGTLLATACDDHTVRIWEAHNGAQRALFSGHEDEVWHLSFSPDGTKIASGGQDRTVRLWEVKSGRALAVLTGHTAGVDWPVFSPDGSRLLSVAADPLPWLWDITTGKAVRPLLGHTEQVLWGAFSPENGDIMTGGRDGTLRRWDGRSGLPPRQKEDGGLLLPVGPAGPVGPGAEDGPTLSAREAMHWACRLLRIQPEYQSVATLCAANQSGD